MAGEKFLIHGGMRLEGQIAVSGGCLLYTSDAADD